MKEKYEVFAFLSKQDAEWKEHQREIGFFGRLYEYIFGSKFAHNQLEEFKEFLKHRKENNNEHTTTKSPNSGTTRCHNG